MLIRPHDATVDDGEWRTFLADHDFGQVIAPGDGTDLPVVVPTHFRFDGGDEVILHLARANPLWAALEARPEVVLSVIAAYVYVPTSWNAPPANPPEWGVPTSYYAAVQLACSAAVVDDPEELAALLRAQVAHFQPEGGHEPIEAGDNPYGRMLKGIRGLRLTVTGVRAKFKFGGNKPPEVRAGIAELLADRAGPLDAEARDHLLRRMGSD